MTKCRTLPLPQEEIFCGGRSGAESGSEAGLAVKRRNEDQKKNL